MQNLRSHKVGKKHPSICCHTLFEIAISHSRMASYILRNSSSVMCRSTHLGSHNSLTFPTPTAFKPSRFLRMLISSVDYSCRCLVGGYLKNIARVCRVDIMFCISGTLHALDSAIVMLWLYTVAMCIQTKLVTR